jgi:predicted permease
MRMTLNGQRYQTAAQVASFATQVTARVERVPGVERAALTNYLPLAQGMNIPLRSIVGRPNPDGRFLGNLEWFGISPGFFDVMRIRLRSGRAIEEHDTAASPPVVVVNEAFARRYLANETGLGRQVVIAWDLLGPKYADVPRQVIGIVSDIHEGSLKEASSPAVFVPLTQVNDNVSATANQIMPTTLLVRTTGDPSRFGREVANQVHAVDAMLPVFDILSMEQVLGDSIQTERIMMMLLGGFAGLALVLAAIGIYGVMSYAVAQRTREIGIRAALGASSASLMKMILGQGLMLAGVGVVIGVAGAAVLTSLLKSFLYGVTSRDLATFIGTPLLLTVIGLVACYVPARRALRVDPVDALRENG